MLLSFICLILIGNSKIFSTRLRILPTFEEASSPFIQMFEIDKINLEIILEKEQVLKELDEE